jgi:hypothetical protein
VMAAVRPVMCPRSWPGSTSCTRRRGLAPTRLPGTPADDVNPPGRYSQPTGCGLPVRTANPAGPPDPFVNRTHRAGVWGECARRRRPVPGTGSPRCACAEDVAGPRCHGGPYSSKVLPGAPGSLVGTGARMRSQAPVTGQDAVAPFCLGSGTPEVVAAVDSMRVPWMTSSPRVFVPLLSPTTPLASPVPRGRPGVIALSSRSCRPVLPGRGRA